MRPKGGAQSHPFSRFGVSAWPASCKLLSLALAGWLAGRQDWRVLQAGLIADIVGSFALPSPQENPIRARARLTKLD